MGAKLFGARVKRLEDPALLTGQGRFIDDIHLPGVLHAAFVRSPHGLRAPATETDVTVAARRPPRDIMSKSYVPRRETVPREARPKILRTKF